MFNQSGIIVLNKPCGISSNSAVNKVKRLLGAKKSGHLGTLDLEASGVLLVTVNNATKLFDLFLQKEKSYLAVFEFGKETDTLDASGKVTKQEVCDVTELNLQRACNSMLGKQNQLPPQFSAKKVDGKVAYNEARAGREIELSPKEIEIFEFSVQEKLEKNVFSVGVTCSSGTYIRALARDVAKKLGTCGFMRSLVRTRCGGFGLDEATLLDGAAKDSLLKSFVPAEKLFDFQKIQLSKSEEEKLLNGQKIPFLKADGEYKIFSEAKFLGLGVVEGGFLKLNLRLGDYLTE